jgi:hypothetical protein
VNSLQRALPFLCLLLFSLPCCAQGLDAPTGLVVVRDGEMYKGTWKPVTGASYYEVWIKNFGRWTFNPNTLATSPFTSSFEIRVEDDRARFKVRAVKSDGIAGEYSSDIAPVKKAAQTADSQNRDPKTNNGGKVERFDPHAPPPEPPTGLFTIWTEPGVIKLVWQGSEGAKNYAVEELRDGKWTSPRKIEFPRKNTAMIKNHPAPGPYKFRVRAVGNNGRASKPSRTTTAKR